mgnify:CR=1 FL=1
MSVAETIRSKLETAFSPSELDVIDQSHLHAGHAGAPAGGESHFRVRMVSAEFAGKSRLERQRMVNTVLSAELAGPVHALALSLDAE